MGGCEELKSCETKISAGCGAEYEEQTSRNRFEEHRGSQRRITIKDGESGNAGQKCNGSRGWELNGDKLQKGCCRGDQQSKARHGHERNRATTVAGYREAVIE